MLRHNRTFTFRMTVSTYPDREFRDGGYAMRPLSLAAVSSQGMQQALQPALASAGRHTASRQHWVTPCGHADLSRRKTGASRQ